MSGNVSVNQLKNEIKSQVTMPMLVAYLLEKAGYPPVNSQRMCNCLVHDDANPSMMVNEDTAYCFGCVESWDVIELVRKHEGLDFVQTLHWFQEHFDVLKNTRIPNNAPTNPKADTSDLSQEWL